MKILILEDDLTRVKLFKKKFIAHSIIHVEHAKDAINELKSTEFDLICLDHDLGGLQMEYEQEDCGMLVAEYLAQNYPKNGPKVVVHSFNVPRGKLMTEIIPGAVYLPGYWI